MEFTVALASLERPIKTLSNCLDELLVVEEVLFGLIHFKVVAGAILGERGESC